MEVLLVKIKDIRLAPYNPRTMPAGEMDKLKKSIQEFKCYTPLIVNRRIMQVVGGNQRLRALQELGYEEVYVVFVDLSLAQEKALNIALNRIKGDWDEAKLAEILQELSQIPEFDEGLTGFSDAEMSRILDEHAVSLEDDFDEEKELEAVDEPITVSGDLIDMAGHLVICGDTASSDTVARLLGQDKIAVVHQDSPFGVGYDSRNRPTGEKKGVGPRWKPIVNDELIGDEHVKWVMGIMENVKPYLLEGAAIYLWDGFVNFGPLTQELSAAGVHVSNIITWVKPNPCPSFADYWFGSEFLIYGWLKGSGPHRWFGPKAESNVWHVERDQAAGSLHPTAKPVELARRVIRNSSVRGDIVFDGTCGAGFNLIACEQLGRVFRGVEIEPAYCDVMVRRFARTFGVEKLSAQLREKYLQKGAVA